MTTPFENHIANAQRIFDNFPNEQVWLQGGLEPNRQLQKPEAGYCIAFRYDEKTTGVVLQFMTKVRALLPPVVEYNAHTLHTTIGVYGKEAMAQFVLDAATLKPLTESVAAGLSNCPANPCIELRQWLFNNEAILISGYPNQDLWQLMQNIGRACRRNGYPLEMSRITHITTTRFISPVSRHVFEQFTSLMNAAPLIGSVRPRSVDLATWQCDGLTFDLDIHNRYHL